MKNEVRSVEREAMSEEREAMSEERGTRRVQWFRNKKTGLQWLVDGALVERLAADPDYEEIADPGASAPAPASTSKRKRGRKRVRNEK